jgi:hypothetical protein
MHMNSDKTEIIRFSSLGAHVHLAKLAARDCSLRLESMTILPARVLGVMLDAELTMKLHIAKTAATCFDYLRRLRQILQHVGEDVAARLVLALVTSPLDYNNSSLAGLPRSSLDPLQRLP